MYAYHFFADTLRDGQPVPADGELLSVDPHRLELCAYGLHASRHPYDALKYAPGANLAIVELSGRVLEERDKLCASERTIIARIDATNLLQEYARKCALDVIHLWDAPAVVREFLETGREDLEEGAYAAANAAANANATPNAYAARAARAAYATTTYAARAAYVTTTNAARAVTRAARAANGAAAYVDTELQAGQRRRLGKLVYQAFTTKGGQS